MTRIRSIALLSSIPLVTLMAGCGGSPAGGVNSPPSETLVVSPGNVRMRPGGTFAFERIAGSDQHSYVTWSASNGTINGTEQGIFKAPAAAGAYLVRATSNLDPQVTGTTTVVVDPAAPTISVRLIGNSQIAEVSQTKAILELKGFSVTTSPSLTGVPTEDVILIHSSIALSPVVNEEQLCEDTLRVGKGLVWLGRGLGGPGTTNLDTSGIAAWFGAMRINTGLNTYDFTTNHSTGSFPLPAGILPGAKAARRTGSAANWGVFANQVLPLAVPILTNDYPAQSEVLGAFAFTPPIGGRVYFQFHPYGFDQKTRGTTILMLMAGTAWASGK
jgi:hypothetical protein